LDKDSDFCGECGTKVVKEQIKAPERICKGCNNALDDGLIFCNKCGKKYEATELPLSGGGYTVVIERKQQIYGFAMKAEIILNGTNYGKLSVGKTMTVNVNEPIIDASFNSLGLPPLKAKLQLTEKTAYIKIKYGSYGIVFNGLSGAKLI
jgi:hypothetical protein